MTASRTAAAIANDRLGLPSPAFTPDCFGILVDSREQTPWSIPDDVPFDVQSLPSGDYSVAGFGNRIACERKSLADYLSSCFGDWPRFRKEMSRLETYERAWIAVEATHESAKVDYRKALEPAVKGGAKWAREFVELPPQRAIARIVASFTVLHGEFGVPVLWLGTPDRAAAYSFQTMRAWHKRQLLARRSADASVQSSGAR